MQPSAAIDRLHMLKTIVDFFNQNLRTDVSASNPHAIQVAAGALLIEAARMDAHTSDAERAAVVASVRAKFALSDEEATRLLALAEEEARVATDYYQFTALINQHFTPAQKYRLIELLWEVAYVDQKVDMYEEHYIRKIADLLYVPHAQYIAAKLKVRDTAR